jgi:hypothetical protein
MDQQDLTKTSSQKETVPQFQIRTDLSAGASVESCMQDLAYWQNAYAQMCGAPVPTPY